MNFRCKCIASFIQKITYEASRHRQPMKNLSSMFVITKILLFIFHTCRAIDSISKFESLSENTTLVSKDGSFELGFFCPGSSGNCYLGIWYKRIPVKTVVWVANRANPVKDNSSILHINKQGNLVIVTENGTVVWTGLADSRNKAFNPFVQLLDTGNLVIRDEKDEDVENYLWQSFDYPSDTLLPGMKLGWDLQTGLNRHLSAWKNWDDPSPGDFTLGLALEGYPQIVMWKGPTAFYRGGHWNGITFSGAPELKENPLFEFEFVYNKEEVYYTYSLRNESMISRMVMNQTVYTRQRYVWIEGAQTWRLYASVPRDNCDYYNLCGPNGNCVIGDSPICQCLSGFKPKSPENWDMMDWTQGCVHNQQLSCQDKSKDGFLKFSGLKYPDTTHAWVNESMDLNKCRETCLGNCSCTAYANLDIRGGGTGCVIWFGELRDMRQFSGEARDLYIRMTTSEFAEKDVHKRKVAAIVISVASVLVVILIFSYISKRMKKLEVEETENYLMENNVESMKENLELTSFDLSRILKATNGFSTNKKLGEGGFGTVYRGILEDGQEIAVKRLSQSSRQGLNEFMNEVILIAKLQHRNLVKLLGFCVEGEEKMLIYEYMSNNSLDSFIFDHVKSKVLDWSKRFNIIYGIARGLLYLHEDSRLKIIHRDLKASNVLLDNEFNPKISDFGMARTIVGDQIEGNTNMVVGTYGYMAPEYAINGLFSVKSDIFSFGVLLLEIVCGKKNREFSHSDNCINLIGHAWRFWKEERALELIDSCFKNSCIQSQALRCIQISLLCVQRHPEDRPIMSTVVLMLITDIALPQPKEPAFLIDNVLVGADSYHNHQLSTSNGVSITKLEPR
ncbi:G-type lectin S-receptor-like serine/threonine-protein kinase At4g27290 [Abrus precatorius]|uniref:Receptor-like serine/threonine-protein kinase n=1 Tax=Abrus precatorius TaxID=3816 RepID=A0A8B8LL66_ABRPR|nr:G-type lectin S-receptor-like serine/threonine-protein kinase At4g27290 [Abrus precatorius]